MYISLYNVPKTSYYLVNDVLIKSFLLFREVVRSLYGFALSLTR